MSNKRIEMITNKKKAKNKICKVKNIKLGEKQKNEI